MPRAAAVVLDDGAGEAADANGITAAHDVARSAVSPAASPALPALTWASTFGSGSWQLWGRDYDPPGNYVGEKPC